MLSLTRRPGQTIHIGNEIRLIVRHKLRSIVLIELYAPAGAAVLHEGAVSAGSALSGGRALHRLKALVGDSVLVAGVRVLVGEDAMRSGGRQVRLHFDAPRSVVINRAEVHRRQRRMPQFGCLPVVRNKSQQPMAVAASASAVRQRDMELR